MLMSKYKDLKEQHLHLLGKVTELEKRIKDKEADVDDAKAFTAHGKLLNELDLTFVQNDNYYRYDKDVLQFISNDEKYTLNTTLHKLTKSSHGEIAITEEDAKHLEQVIKAARFKFYHVKSISSNSNSFSYNLFKKKATSKK